MAIEAKIVEFVAPHIVTGVKYIASVVKNWWNNRKSNKQIQKVESKIENLMKENQELLKQLEAKKEEEIGDNEVKLANKQLKEVKNLEKVIGEDVTSYNAFYTWLSSGVKNKTFQEDMDVLEVGEIYKSRLAEFINKAQQNRVSRYTIDAYQDLLTDILINIKYLKKARKEKARSGTFGVIASELIGQRERALWACIQQSEELLRKT